MGNKGGKKKATGEEELRRDAAVLKELEEEKKTERDVKKLLLLGPGESGKSTFMKQMIIGYRGGFTAEKRTVWRSTIRTLLVEAVVEMESWIELNWKEKLADSAGEGLSAKHKELAAKLRVIQHKKSDCESLFLETYGQISEFWYDPLVQLVWTEHRPATQIPESTQYFMEKIAEVGSMTFSPSDNDLLLLSTRTSGIVEEEFIVEGQPFRLLDVGGQRSERKKWLLCFTGVSAVLYVAAISEYDQTLCEDGATNRVYEAINLFDEMISNPVFKTTTFVLFLNKEDLFRKKITKVPLKNYFPEYTGADTFEEASEFIAEIFTSKFADKTPDEFSRTLFVHFTCATDTQKTMIVFDAVKTAVIRGVIRDAGLI